MGFLRVIFIQILIFAAIGVFAKEHGHHEHGHHEHGIQEQEDDRFFNMNFHPHLPGNASFGDLLSNLFPFFSRSAELEAPHNATDEQHDRFFFRFPTFSACNYTTNPGATCNSCTQAVTCLPSNVGLVRQCRGLFRFCNNGYCSLFQGAACNGTTSG